MRLYFVLIAIMCIGGCCRDFDIQRHMKDCMLQYEQNPLAYQRGYAVCIHIGEGILKWRGASYTLSMLEDAIAESIRKEKLSRQEISRAPFTVVAVGHCQYQKILRVFEVGERLGFSVKGMFVVGMSNAKGETSRAISAAVPCLEEGHSLPDMMVPESWAVVDVYADGAAAVNGTAVGKVVGDVRNLQYVKEVKSRSSALRMQGLIPVLLLRIDAHADAYVVARAIDLGVEAGADYALLMGVRYGTEIDDAEFFGHKIYAESRYVVVSAPCPDGFYWGAEDYEE